MKPRGTIFNLFYSIFIVISVGCASQAPSRVESATPPAAVVPYQTPSATATTVISFPGVTPSPTPYLYTVQPNDTFFSIADRLSVNMSELIAANPGVDPRLLIPGTQLLIPVEGQIILSTILPTLTPVAAQVNPVACYSSATTELWCFLLVTNDGDRAMENLIGEVNLVSADGRVLASEQASPPLDLLATGSRMPLVAYFASPPEVWAGAQGSLLTGFWLQGDDPYLNASILNFDWDLGDAETQLSAHVRGIVQLNGDARANRVWVLAVAYDAQGQVVGFRRWESAGELTFDFWVYSLGPKIDNIEVLVEAVP